MKRREFITLLGGAAAAWPVAARAQQERMRRIGVLMNLAADDPEALGRITAFVQGLQQLGWTDGRNVRIDARWAAGNADNFRKYAAELIALAPDGILATSTQAVTALQQATHTVPIVFVLVTDPVGQGVIASLARPGGNATGITNVAAILAGKRLELLKEVMPRVTRVAVMWDPRAPGSTPQWDSSKQPAEKLRLRLYSMEASNVEDYVGAFKGAVRAHSQAVSVTLNPVANSNQKLIAELAIDSGLPSICARGDYAENGCLIAYGPSYKTEGSDGARYVDRILKGAKPAELPIAQPTIFELVINLKTASRLGVTVPQSVLDRADKLVR